MAHTIRALKDRYPGEWLAIRVTRCEEFQPVEGELLFHHEREAMVQQNVELLNTECVYLTYAGVLIEEGHGVAFL